MNTLSSLERRTSLSIEATSPHDNYLLLSRDLFLRGDVHARGSTQTGEAMVELGRRLSEFVFVF